MSNGGTPRSNLVPGDEHYHDGKHLMADLTDLNGKVSRYVLRHLDAEAGRSVPTSADDEYDLGVRLARLGLQVLERAERRRQPVQERSS
jgi:hypothetical protein